MENNTVTGVAIMNKCTFCHDRVTNGEQPACAAACTTGAITYGKRAELIAQGEERVTGLRGQNIGASIYGVDEVHGLHVMYVLDDSPEVYGLPADPQVPATSTVRDVLRWVGSGLAVAVVAGFGLNYLVARLRLRRQEKR
jgi:formate dehydrogenase iron-sulfur subunit